jgi:hypothetical protein
MSHDAEVEEVVILNLTWPGRIRANNRHWWLVFA